MIAAHSGYRDRVINSLPTSVIFAFTAALSALFIKTALNIFSEFKIHLEKSEEISRNYEIMLFLCIVASFFLLFMTFFRRSHVFIEFLNRQGQNWRLILKIVSFSDVIIVVSLISLITCIWFDEYYAYHATSPGLQWHSFIDYINALENSNPVQWILAFVFACAIAFTLIVDIPGTPNSVFIDEYLDKIKKKNHSILIIMQKSQ